MRRKTRALASRYVETSCPRSCAVARTGWRRLLRRRRAWRRRNARRMMRAGAARSGSAIPGWAAIQARYGEPEDKAQRQLHRPRQRHHEDQRRGVPAMLQRAGGGGRRPSVDCRDGVDLERERPGRDGGGCSMRWRRPSTRSPRRCLPTPGTAMSGTCRSSKRGVSTGMWRRGGRGKRRRAATRHAPGDAPMVEKLATPAGLGAVRATQVAVRSAQWLDQGSPGFRRFSVRGLNKARGEWTWCVWR